MNFVPDRNYNWIAVFCIPRGVGKSHRSVIYAHNEAATRSPKFLSWRQTLCIITMIHSLSNINSRYFMSLFDDVTSDKVAYFNNQSIKCDAILRDLCGLINCGDYDHNNNGMKVLLDYLYFNVYRNSKVSKFEYFWETMAEVISMNGSIKDPHGAMTKTNPRINSRLLPPALIFITHASNMNQA